MSNHSLPWAAILLYRLEMLEDGDAIKVRKHLESCTECREMLGARSQFDWGGEETPGHIPANVLARWDRAQHELLGLERAFVRAHLEDCADCRQDLELLGKTAALPMVAELELREGLAEHLAFLREAPSEMPAPVTRVPTSTGYTIRVVQGNGRSHSKRERIYQGWALAASIAAAVLAFGGPLFRGTGPEPRVAVRDTVQVSPGPDSRLALEIVTPPKTLPSAAPNGTRAPVTRIDISPGDDVMQLALKDIPSGRNIEIEVFSGNGEKLGTQRIDASQLEAGDILRMRAFGELAPGSYLLRLRGSAIGDTATLGSVDYPILLQRAAPQDSTTR